MKLSIKKSIEENIIKVDISVADLGTTTSTGSEEAQILTDFPRSVRFSDINFKANMKIDDTTGDPIVTTDAVDNTTIEEVKIENVNNALPLPYHKKALELFVKKLQCKNRDYKKF